MTFDTTGLTEEQIAAINAEIDRERTKASDTAYKNALKKAEAERQSAIEAAIEDERKRLEMNEAEKLEAERAKVEEARKALAAEQKSLKATKKLAVAGFNEEAIESLIPLFVGIDDKAFDTAVDSFIAVNQNIVKTQVDTVKQELLANATPPANGSNAPVDAGTAAADALKNGDSVAAIELLLNQAGQGQ